MITSLFTATKWLMVVWGINQGGQAAPEYYDTEALCQADGLRYIAIFQEELQKAYPEGHKPWYGYHTCIPLNLLEE